MFKTKNLFLYFLVFFLSFSCEKENYSLTKIKGELITLDSTSLSKEQIKSVIKPYKDSMIKEINTVISFAPKSLVRTDGKLQSSLGNLIADLCFEKADSIFFAKTGNHVDFAMSNYGGIRAGIDKGNVTNRNVFELMPFENTLVVVELTGEKILELGTYFFKGKTAHPLSKQVQMKINSKGFDIRVSNKMILKDKTYFVATSNYLLSGGDRMYFFKNPVSVFESNYLIRNAIKSYFKSKDTLVSSLDNRVILN